MTLIDNSAKKSNIWNLFFACCWVIYSAIYFNFCFQPGILRSDDFGYIRSILGTLERGKLYTYEWLEPFGAFFSFLCSIIYTLSGNFYFATNGAQALFVLLFFPLLYRLFVDRFAVHHAAVWALVFASSPLFLVKESDFHACISTIDLFLAALIFFENSKPKLFFAVAFLAFANRQNQICLLILPVWNLSIHFFRTKKIDRILLIGIFCFLISSVVLYLTMNKTFATTHAPFINLSWKELGVNFLIALLGGTFVSLGAFSFISFLSEFYETDATPKKPYWFFRIALCFILLIFIPFWSIDLIKFDTQFFGIFGWAQVNHTLPWLVLPLLLVLNFRLFIPHAYFVLIAGYIFTASLRGTWWDYYFMEIFILSILILRPVTSNLKSNSKNHFLVGCLAFTLLLGNIFYGYLLKIQSDKQRLTVYEMENLERQNRIHVDQMTGATFGYLGWKLYDLYMIKMHNNLENGKIFLDGVKQDRVVIDTYVPWRKSFKNQLPTTAQLLDSGSCHIGFQNLKFRVVDLNGPNQNKSISGSNYNPDFTLSNSPPFPLNNSEWRAYIDSGKYHE